MHYRQDLQVKVLFLFFMYFFICQMLKKWSGIYIFKGLYYNCLFTASALEMYSQDQCLDTFYNGWISPNFPKVAKHNQSKWVCKCKGLQQFRQHFPEVDKAPVRAPKCILAILLIWNICRITDSIEINKFSSIPTLISWHLQECMYLNLTITSFHTSRGGARKTKCQQCGTAVKL